MLARKAVVAQLDALAEHLKDASAGLMTSRAHNLTADFAMLAGSISWDAGLYASAQRYYVMAAELSQLAAAPLNTAIALAALARQSFDSGHTSDGLDIVRLALQGTREFGTPRLRAFLLTREAWGYAQKGYVKEFHRAVGAAHECFAEGGAPDDPRSVRNFDEAEFAGTVGARFRDLAKFHPDYAVKAQTHISTALELREPGKIRNRVFDLVGLARSYLLSKEPEHACTLVRQAMSLAEPLIAGRVARKIRQFHAESLPYASVPVVAETRTLIYDRVSPTV